MNVYQIGVNIALSSNAGAVLGQLGRQMLGLHQSVQLTQQALRNMQLAAVGALGVVAGTGALRTMWSLVDAAKEFRHQMALMQAANFSPAEVAGAARKAWEVAVAVPGTTATGNLALIADLRNVLGDQAKAEKVAEVMARVGAVLETVTGKPAEQAAFQFARFLELRGALVDPKTHQIDEERLLRQARIGEAIIVATRGRVGPAELLNFQQQARAAGAMLSDEGMINIVPFLQASGGFRAGTMSAAVVQNLIAGVLTQRSANWLEEMGLLPESAVHVQRGGHITIDRDKLAGSDELLHDPLKWAENVLMPALKKHGGTDDEAMTKLLLQSGLRQTSIGELVELVRNSPAFNKDVENIKRALGTDQYDVLLKNDPTLKMKAFSDAWQNLMTALGLPMVDVATTAMLKVARVMNDIAAWAAAHPEMVGMIEGVAAAIGVGVTVGGAVTLVGAIAALAGPAAGVAAAAAGVSALAAAVAVLSAAVSPWLEKHLGPGVNDPAFQKRAPGEPTVYPWTIMPDGRPLWQHREWWGFGKGDSGPIPTPAPPPADRSVPPPIPLMRYDAPSPSPADRSVPPVVLPVRQDAPTAAPVIRAVWDGASPTLRLIESPAPETPRRAPSELGPDDMRPFGERYRAHGRSGSWPAELGPGEDRHVMEGFRNIPRRSPPGRACEPVLVWVMNGRDIARGVTLEQTRHLTAPEAGPTWYDRRTTPLHPGATEAA